MLENLRRRYHLSFHSHRGWVAVTKSEEVSYGTVTWTEYERCLCGNYRKDYRKPKELLSNDD